MDSLLGVTKKAAGEFFVEVLMDAAPPKVRLDEVRYVASILAHFALTSCNEVAWEQAPKDLTEVFNRFVVPAYTYCRALDLDFLVNGGAQSLLLAGFFRKQMQARRHNVRFYDRIGSNFYLQASHLESAPPQQDLYFRLGIGFEKWAYTCQKVSAVLRQNQNKRYFLPVPPLN